MNVGLLKGETLASLHANNPFTKFSCSFSVKYAPFFTAILFAIDFAIPSFKENELSGISSCKVVINSSITIGISLS